MTVRNIMTADPTCITGDATIREAAKSMVTADCGAIPVVADGNSRQVIGIVTDRDIACRAVANGLDPEATLVSQVMSTDIRCANADDPVSETLRVMQDHQIRRMPVVDHGGSLIGILAQADVALGTTGKDTAELVEDVSKPYLR